MNLCNELVKDVFNSEFENHVVSVTQSVKVLLHHIFEGRGAAVEDNSVLTWGREFLLYMVYSHEAHRVGPLVGGLHIHSVVEIEAVRIVLLELVELIAQKDIFDCAIAENQ
jgi:enamine deaminase RidA (YjgF/YER057c/UK114 family)